jgi:hypothetical protein
MALLLATPAAATGRPSHMGAVAQERAFMQQANAHRVPPRTATAGPADPSTPLVAGSIAGLLLAAAGGLAAVAVRRRHARDAAVSLPAR